MLLIDDLLLLPFKGLMAVFKKVAEAAEEELTDEGKVKEELLKLEMLYETDQITKEQFKRREKKLIKRLEEIRKYKESLK